ncbi:MAG TPA: hypothetical protein VMW31_02435 [Devosiaceae bacterium]|nr:hypothetical protein [Devosiaceae bacterium]
MASDHTAAHSAGQAVSPGLPPHFLQNLAGIVVVVAVLALAAVYGLQTATRNIGDGMPESPGEPVRFTLAATELGVPRNWLRAQRGGGFAESIEMEVPLALPGVAERLAARITLLPRARATPSAALLDTLYIHRFTITQVGGPRGLVGKPLRPEAGYQNETVWYDPVSGNPFVAKCLVIEGGARPRAECMRTLALGARISAVVRFDGSALRQWQEFDAAVSAALDRLL